MFPLPRWLYTGNIPTLFAIFGKGLANHRVRISTMLNNKTIDDLLKVNEIYLEPEVKNYKRGQKVLAKYPDATVIEVPSHWKIPELHVRYAF